MTGLEPILVCGVGVVTAAGIGTHALLDLLRGVNVPKTYELPQLKPPDLALSVENDSSMTKRARRLVHRSPPSAIATVLAVTEAWNDAVPVGSESDPAVTFIIVAGTQLQRTVQHEATLAYHRSPLEVSPTYGLRFLDSHYLGLVSELLPRADDGIVLGAASASGTVAVAHAMRLLRAKLCDTCVVVAPPCILTNVERVALRSMGALSLGVEPQSVPFDERCSGFVYGEGAGCLILRRDSSTVASGTPPVSLVGCATSLHGTASPRPSAVAEAGVMRSALADAKLLPSDIALVNAHGTASPAGGEVELEGLHEVFGEDVASVPIASTKALLGHTLTAAGVVELAACVLQLRHSFVHGHPGIEQSIRPGWRINGREPRPLSPGPVLKNGFGFGGINSTIIMTPASGEK